MDVGEPIVALGPKAVAAPSGVSPDTESVDSTAEEIKTLPRAPCECPLSRLAPRAGARRYAKAYEMMSTSEALTASDALCCGTDALPARFPPR